MNFKQQLSSWIAKIQGTKKVEPVATLLIPTEGSFLLKKLKWVVHNDQVAIVYELDRGGFATLHYVNSEGFTVREGRANCGELRLAKFLEIPESRRIGMSPQYAATLGYF